METMHDWSTGYVKSRRNLVQFHRPVKLKLVTVRRAKFGREKMCVLLLQVGHFFVFADGYVIAHE